MPRVVQIYRKLLAQIDQTKLLIELLDYSNRHIVIAVYSDAKNVTYRVEDLVDERKKAAVSEDSLKIKNMESDEEFTLSEESFYSTFPTLG